MIIRGLESCDVDRLRAIHEKFYKEEFDFPDFCDKFINAFVVEDNNDIIAAGGVRTLLESVVITNKDFNAKDRKEALLKLFQVSHWTAQQYGYDSIHAFILDEVWKRRLLRSGFRMTKGQSLLIEV